MTDAATEERLALAEAFLQEAVYHSRSAQAGAALFAANDPEAGRCGLGVEAEVVLDLSPAGEKLFGRIWPDGLTPDALQTLQAVMTGWIERQDALDRQRNHFLKEFRRTHGFDRAAYTPEQAAAQRAGLDNVNGEVDEGRRAAARELMAIT